MSGRRAGNPIIRWSSRWTTGLELARGRGVYRQCYVIGTEAASPNR